MLDSASEGQAAHARRWWFIYYRVRVRDLAAAIAAARAAQQALQSAHPGLAVSLMQRPEPDAQQLMTLMETYSAPLDWAAPRLAGLPEAIDATAGHALTPWLQGPRQLEVFDPCAWPP